MRPWRDRAILQGRLHGRLLLVLIVVAVLVSAAAVLQFTLLRDDGRPALADLADSEEASAEPEVSAEADSPTASASPTPSPTIESAPASATAAAPSPSESAVPSPEPTTEAAPAPLQCTATLSIGDQWSETVLVRVAVANSGTESVDGWEVVIDVPNLEVTSAWGLSHIEGNRYGDILFNASIGPGDSVEPSFFADFEGELSLPATVPCTPEA